MNIWKGARSVKARPHHPPKIPKRSEDRETPDLRTGVVFAQLCQACGGLGSFVDEDGTKMVCHVCDGRSTIPCDESTHDAGEVIAIVDDDDL